MAQTSSSEAPDTYQLTLIEPRISLRDVPGVDRVLTDFFHHATLWKRSLDRGQNARPIEYITFGDRAQPNPPPHPRPQRRHCGVPPPPRRFIFEVICEYFGEGSRYHRRLFTYDCFDYVAYDMVAFFEVYPIPDFYWD